jgi:DNA-binding transcriptional LysR family regulator
MRQAVLPDMGMSTARDATANLRLVGTSLKDAESSAVQGRGFFTPAKLEAFVAVAEEGSISAAARRLCVSQPALSQTINAIERRLGVELFLRSTTGVERTEAGQALLDEARAILSRFDHLLPAMVRYRSGSEGVLRVGIPHELASKVFSCLANFVTDCPATRVLPRHLPIDDQLAALRSGRLDVSFMVEVPVGRDLDNFLVAREELGVLLARGIASRFAGANGVRLDALIGLDWVPFPRSTSPAWYDELAAILRTHGVDVGSLDRGDQFPNPSVVLTALCSTGAFALAPRPFAHPLPDSVLWVPLDGEPVVRSTWAVWPASSRRRDVARLVTLFEPT